MLKTQKRNGEKMNSPIQKPCSQLITREVAFCSSPERSATILELLSISGQVNWIESAPQWRHCKRLSILDGSWQLNCTAVRIKSVLEIYDQLDDHCVIATCKASMFTRNYLEGSYGKRFLRSKGKYWKELKNLSKCFLIYGNYHTSQENTTHRCKWDRIKIQ